MNTNGEYTAIRVGVQMFTSDISTRKKKKRIKLKNKQEKAIYYGRSPTLYRPTIPEGNQRMHTYLHIADVTLNSTFNPLGLNTCNLYIHSSASFFQEGKSVHPTPLTLGIESRTMKCISHSEWPMSLKCLETGKSILFLRMLYLCPFNLVLIEQVVSPT